MQSPLTQTEYGADPDYKKPPTINGKVMRTCTETGAVVVIVIVVVGGGGGGGGGGRNQGW